MLEQLGSRFNIALIPFFNEKQDLPRYPEFVDKIKSYRNCQIVLHGLYHERKSGQFDNFHSAKKSNAEVQIRAALQIFSEIGLKTNVFIPPAWKLNTGAIEVLEKLKFRLAEEQEEYLLLNSKEFTKIRLPKVLNWDSTGFPKKNAVNMARDQRAFKRYLEQQQPMIRVALHPRDPAHAQKDQRLIVSTLQDHDYEIPTYSELIPKLEQFTSLKNPAYAA